DLADNIQKDTMLFNLDAESLQDPKILIELTENGKEITAELTAMTDLSGFNLVLMAVVVKKEIEIDGQNHYHVVRQFIPDPAGYPLETSNLVAGTGLTENISLSQVSNAELRNSNLVIFVQDIDNNVIYQATNFDLSVITELQSPEEIAQVIIYPVPADEYVIVESNRLMKEISLSDISGRIMQIYKPDSPTYQLPLSEYKNGIYFVKGYNEDGRFSRVIIKR
ncbi:MAG TPA: T9SS type A sorting domain-containing protein, partial [Bacteroidales bacterium]|nr:T9SS type A sorting domain-containing protein [Bacteroidales bacterium]